MIEEIKEALFDLEYARGMYMSIKEDIATDAPKWLSYLLDELEKAQKENERLSTCPDCGGSGVI